MRKSTWNNNRVGGQKDERDIWRTKEIGRMQLTDLQCQSQPVDKIESINVIILYNIYA